MPSLSETDKLKIAKILGVDYVTINDQIFNLGSAYVTDAVVTMVQAEITRWDAGVGSDFVNIEPNTANYGARINPDNEKADIRKNIATLLYLQDLIGSFNTVSLVRG